MLRTLSGWSAAAQALSAMPYTAGARGAAARAARTAGRISALRLRGSSDRSSPSRADTSAGLPARMARYAVGRAGIVTPALEIERPGNTRLLGPRSSRQLGAKRSTGRNEPVGPSDHLTEGWDRRRK